MKKITKNILRIVISILYIVWGITAPLTALDAILAFNIPALISALTGLIMLSAGISGLIGLRRIKCRILGFVIFVLALVVVVTALPAIAVNSIVSAILAWLFIICM